MTTCTFILSPLFPSTHSRSLLSTRPPINYLFQCINSSRFCLAPSVGRSLVCSDPSKGQSSLFCVKNAAEEGVVAVADLEELDEKDWSFLEVDDINSKEEHDDKVDKILSVGHIKDTSKVLVHMASGEFIDRLVDSSPCQQLVVVHDSFLALACIKEIHDKVKCWQGELLSVPEKWAPFDTVFLHFLPALPSTLYETIKILARLSAPGARVVISHLHGRKGLEQQRQQHPNTVFCELPDKLSLEKVASNQSFKIIEHIDDPSFYLAVLEFTNWKYNV